MTGEGRRERRRWQVWVDTGGTFTDCLARDPRGRLHRAKVLSISALRARLASREGARRLRVEAPWSLPDGFFRGCRLAFLGSPRSREWRILDSWGGGRGLALEENLPRRLESGSLCELRSPEEAPVLAARLITGTAHGETLPALDLRLATTRGTNALLERKGARVALFLTAGFGDLLLIGDQQRPDLFTLHVRRQEPLTTTVVEVDERQGAHGEVIRALDLEALASPIASLRAAGFESAAVALVHSFRAPEHEQAVGAALRCAGFRWVAESAGLAATQGYLARAETAVVEAYLAPLLSEYFERVAGALPRARLLAMTSAGGLLRQDRFRAKDGLLSGPAGGVVGAAQAARQSGIARLLSFDMGGTSTDVARWDGEFDYQFEHRVGGIRLRAPALAIETVAAGGGSVCDFDGFQLKVGPQSAGARPGPAAYGAGGPLTLTDVNLLLGRLVPERFALPLEMAAAEEAFAKVARRVASRGAGSAATEGLLMGFLQIANERMAEAIREISVRRGYDPRGYTLVAFGGAGGQHACAVAGLLGVRSVLIPGEAGLLSAAGLGAARLERFAEKQVLAPLASVHRTIPRWLMDLEREALAALAEEGVPRAAATLRRLVHLRLAGQESSLAVEFRRGGNLEQAFHRAYRSLYGYPPGDRAIEVETLRVVASSRPRRVPLARRRTRSSPARAVERSRAFFGRRWRRVPVYEREAQPPGTRCDGPALIVEHHGATVVEPGWEAWLEASGALRLAQTRGR